MQRGRISAVVNADNGDDASGWHERRGQIQRIPEGLWSLSELTERNYSCKMEGLSCFVVLMIGRIWRYLSTSMLTHAKYAEYVERQGLAHHIADINHLPGSLRKSSIVKALNAAGFSRHADIEYPIFTNAPMREGLETFQKSKSST